MTEGWIKITVLIFVIIVMTVVSIIFNIIRRPVLEHYPGQINFALSSLEVKKQWLDKLDVGDYLLCNQMDEEPVQVFQVLEISENKIVLAIFDEYFPKGKYEDAKQIFALDLGLGKVKEVKVLDESLKNGTFGALWNEGKLFYIRQIKKK